MAGIEAECYRGIAAATVGHDRLASADDPRAPSHDPLTGVTRLLVDGTNLLHALARGATGPDRQPPAALIGRIRAAIPPETKIELVFDGPSERGLKNERIAHGVSVRYGGRYLGRRGPRDPRRGGDDGGGCSARWWIAGGGRPARRDRRPRPADRGDPARSPDRGCAVAPPPAGAAAPLVTVRRQQPPAADRPTAAGLDVVVRRRGAGALRLVTGPWRDPQEGPGQAPAEDSLDQETGVQRPATT